MRSRLAVIATGLSIFIFLSYILLPSSSHAASNVQFATSSSTTGGKTSSGVNGGGVGGGSGGLSGAGGLHVKPELLKGDVIMPRLGNETIKQELGRASWKLLHTMLARYPQKPTPDEREALHDYMLLFGRLYPCGECAQHFQLLLAKYPPQTSSRDAASQWGCHIHNQVNERLKKPLFDCGTVTEHYKCGCADADGEEGKLGKVGENDGPPTKTTEKGGKDDEEEKKEEEEKKDLVKDDAKPEERPKKTKTLEENVEESVKHGAKIEIERQGPINGG